MLHKPRQAVDLVLPGRNDKVPRRVDIITKFLPDEEIIRIYRRYFGHQALEKMKSQSHVVVLVEGKHMIVNVNRIQGPKGPLKPDDKVSSVPLDSEAPV